MKTEDLKAIVNRIEEYGKSPSQRDAMLASILRLIVAMHVDDYYELIDKIREIKKDD